MSEISQRVSIFGAGYYNQKNEIDLQKKKKNDQEETAKNIGEDTFHKVLESQMSNKNRGYNPNEGDR